MSEEETTKARIAVFLSADPFVRDLFGISAKYKIGEALLLVSGYDLPILFQLIELRPALIILHKPKKRLINLIKSAKSAAFLADTIIQIQPEMSEDAISAPMPFQVRNTHLTERDSRFVQATVAGEDTKSLAKAMAIGEATVRAERARLKREIAEIRALIERMGGDGNR